MEKEFSNAAMSGCDIYLKELTNGKTCKGEVKTCMGEGKTSRGEALRARIKDSNVSSSVDGKNRRSEITTCMVETETRRGDEKNCMGEVKTSRSKALRARMKDSNVSSSVG